ncbi:hypothetical protein HMI55_002390 [Coelomomyces lativittatus]|nr:hypothetical protein HMI55_002390 [Coelomomyces lativittatus]
MSLKRMQERIKEEELKLLKGDTSEFDLNSDVDEGLGSNASLKHRPKAAVANKKRGSRGELIRSTSRARLLDALEEDFHQDMDYRGSRHRGRGRSRSRSRSRDRLSSQGGGGDPSSQSLSSTPTYSSSLPSGGEPRTGFTTDETDDDDDDDEDDGFGEDDDEGHRHEWMDEEEEENEEDEEEDEEEEEKGTTPPPPSSSSRFKYPSNRPSLKDPFPPRSSYDEAPSLIQTTQRRASSTETRPLSSSTSTSTPTEEPDDDEPDPDFDEEEEALFHPVVQRNLDVQVDDPLQRQYSSSKNTSPPSSPPSTHFSFKGKTNTSVFNDTDF